MSDLNIEIKMVDGSVCDLEDYFHGRCEAREEAGKHFSGDCRFDYDLTENLEVIEEQRGMYYLYGEAQAWDVDIEHYEFDSNEEIAKRKLAVGFDLVLNFETEELREYFKRGLYIVNILESEGSRVKIAPTEDVDRNFTIKYEENS